MKIIIKNKVKIRYYNELLLNNEQGFNMKHMRLSGSDNYEHNNNEGNQLMFKEDENDNKQ